jgi:hypothetical protein
LRIATATAAPAQPISAFCSAGVIVVDDMGSVWLSTSTRT